MGFIIIFAAIVASYWAKRKLKVEASSIFKMAIVIMGFGFFVYGFATMEFEKVGSSSMLWLVMAYLFHHWRIMYFLSISFITKLSPVKYASLMMGFYFAATGLGNKVAGIIGESASGWEFCVYGDFSFTIVIGALFFNVAKTI
jgi:POT family proton-dependent oligopeptide transporter